MRKSNCIHCIEVIPLRGKYVKGHKHYDCNIDAWDEQTRCRKNYCNYYDASQQRKDKNNDKREKI